MLRTNDNGTLDPRSVDELAPDALSRWIWNRLHEVDAAAPDDPKQNVGQYYLVGAIYSSLESSTQAEVRRILTRFLKQMEGGGEDWDGRAGDDLLLLAMDVGEPELAAPIRRMAERGQFLDGAGLGEDRHARLVQALADFGAKVTPGFWKQQAQRDPERYLTLAFAGLRNTSVHQALDLLGALAPLSEELEFQLRPSIRSLLRLDGVSRDQLRAMIDRTGTLTPPVRSFIRRTLPEVWEGVADGNGAAGGRTRGRLPEGKLAKLETQARALGWELQPASLAYDGVD